MVDCFGVPRRSHVVRLAIRGSVFQASKRPTSPTGRRYHLESRKMEKCDDRRSGSLFLVEGSRCWAQDHNGNRNSQAVSIVRHGPSAWNHPRSPYQEMLFIESRTRQRSEREPADSLKDKLNVIGGWVAALTFALGRFTCFHETTNAKGSRCNGNLPRTVALCFER